MTDPASSPSTVGLVRCEGDVFFVLWICPECGDKSAVPFALSGQTGAAVGAFLAARRDFLAHAQRVHGADFEALK